MWLVAGSGWAGPGRWLGECAMPVRDGVQCGPGPVPAGQVPAGAMLRRVPGTLLPGLRDAHVHLDLIDPYRLAAGGIAAVDDLGGVASGLGRLHALSLARASGLPRIRFAGAFLTCPGGYPSGRSWASPGSWREVRSAQDAETAVAEQVAAGAGLIKVALNSTAGPVLDGPVLAAVAGAAHRAGRPVIAHAEGAGMVEAALDAGADGLAHTPWTHDLDPAVLRAAAAQQSGWISTLAIHGGSGRAVAVRNLRALLEHGGCVRYGTDQGNGPQPIGVNPVELRALQDAGLSVHEILAAITSTGPQGLSWQAWPPCHVPPVGHDSPSTAAVADLRAAPDLDAAPDFGADVFAHTLARARVIPAQEGAR